MQSIMTGACAFIETLSLTLSHFARMQRGLIIGASFHSLGHMPLNSRFMLRDAMRFIYSASRKERYRFHILYHPRVELDDFA